MRPSTKKLNIEDFISKARSIHGDKYLYDRVVYVDMRTKVEIGCPIHGYFWQNPQRHYTGTGGCSSCSNKKRLTAEEFIRRALEVHGDKYLYDRVVYVSHNHKVEIGCHIHGYFMVNPGNHLSSGTGCMECSGKKKLTTEEFITNARKVHGDIFDYSMVVYKNNKTKVKIICPIHGVFEQKPDSHIQGCGCQKCWNKSSDLEYLKQNLTIEEDPIKIKGVIHCKCTFCKRYFIPKRAHIYNRLYSLSSLHNGEHRLYCSNECKDLCPIFKRSAWPKGHKPRSIRTDQPELREMVLERDNHTCQRCGSSDDLHCHHFTGVEINPIESADIDNCITLCNKCHPISHSVEGCYFSDMKRKTCE